MKCMKEKSCATADAQPQPATDTCGKYLLVYALHDDNAQAYSKLAAFCGRYGFADDVPQSTKLGGASVKCKRSLKKAFAEIAACFDRIKLDEYIALYQVCKSGIELLAVHKAGMEQ